MKNISLTARQRKFVHTQRVARLSTVDVNGRPHVIPICFVVDRCSNILTAIDAKPKRVDNMQLKRVRNISRNPYVAVVFDRYEENWDDLCFLLIHGRAELLTDEKMKVAAVRLLRDKYAQYITYLDDHAPIIRIVPDEITSWGNLQGTDIF